MSVYFISGNEPYLIRRRKLYLQKEGEKNSVTIEQFSLLERDSTYIIAAALNAALFSERKIVFIENLEKAAAKELEHLAENLTRPPEGIDVVFIFNGALKKEHKSLPAMKNILSAAKCFEENLPYLNHLAAWIKNEFRSFGKNISNDAAELMASEIPDDMWALASEIEKCVTYAGAESDITLDDVKTNLYQKGAGNIFDLARALETKDGKNTTATLERLIAGGEEPLVIMDRIYKTFMRIYRARRLAARGIDRQEITKKIMLHPYFDARFFENIKKFTDPELRSIFGIITEYNLKLKRVDNPEDKKLLLTDMTLRILKKDSLKNL